MDNRSDDNRRYFPRVKIRAHAILKDAQGREWPAHVLDLSFNGALVALIHQHTLTVGQTVKLAIESELPDRGRTVIVMQGMLSHIKEHYLGLECRASGIDNQTHLRELLKHSQRQQLASRSYSHLLKDYESQ